MLARFATSDAGKVYGRTCARFGVDPGAVLDDDVMAANLRVALVLGDLEPEAEPDAFGDARATAQAAFS
jgi:hypothetical protein